MRCSRLFGVRARGVAWPQHLRRSLCAGTTVLLPAASNDPASMVAQAMSIYSNVSKGSSFPGGCALLRSPAPPFSPPPPPHPFFHHHHHRRPHRAMLALFSERPDQHSYSTETGPMQGGGDLSDVPEPRCSSSSSSSSSGSCRSGGSGSPDAECAGEQTRTLEAVR